MASAHRISESGNYQDFLDEGQYTKEGIGAYEWIFGEGFISTGGLETSQEIFPLLKLEAGQRVLDVGCGLGGHDFYMAEKYGAIIDGVDLSNNMLAVAHNHLSKRPHLADKVSFRICDVTKTKFDENSYDAIYSRDAMIHIPGKEALITEFYKSLKPGGRLVFTDYCYGDAKKEDYSEEFRSYIAKRDYDLTTVPKYAELIKKTGFTNVLAEAKNDWFAESLHRELKLLYDKKTDFLQKFEQKEFDDLESGWLAKLERIKRGEQTWILCCAEKPV